MSTNLMSIANVHAAQSDYPQAIVHMKQAAALDQSNGEEQNYITCLSDIATFLQEGHISRVQSRLYADSAIRAGNRIRYYRHLPHNLMTLADLAQEEGRYPEALRDYKAALVACDRYQNPFIAAATQVSLGRLYLKTKKANEATLAFQAALGNGEGDLERMEHCYEGLGEAAAMRHDYAMAYDYGRKASTLHDSVFNEQNRETINEIEIRYKTREKQEEIHRLALSNDLQAARAGQKETEKRVAYASIGAILLFVGFGFNRYRRIKRVERERALLTDRLQIGRDLHDDLASSISNISLYGAAVKSKLQQSKAGEAEQLVDKMCADAQEVAASMSDALWLINPTNDTFEKLTDRMRLLADSLLGAHDIDLRFRADERLEQLLLPLQVRKKIYLIFKEALNNLLKYAQATEASVSIRRAEGMLELCVEDNGRGLPKETSARTGFGGNGLRNMQARAARIGGTLELASLASGGVNLALRCPIPKIEDAGRLLADVSLG